jgi:molecular chaperone GrpE
VIYIKNDKNSHKEEIKIEVPKEQIIDPKDVKIDELTDTLKRLQAEFENYKKRVDKEHVQNIKTSNAKLIKDLLAILDSFELALRNNQEENHEISKFRKGLELIYTQLYSTLEDYGLKIIDTKNQKFDPYKHEVLMVKECSEQDDVILQEFQKGYILNDTIIRHSKVMIAKHTEDKKQSENKQ